MRKLLTSAVASVAALGLLIGGGSGPTHANTIVRSPALVTPDANRTKAYFIKFAGGEGSFAIPTLNGLSGTITYYNGVVGEKAKYYTAWGTYGAPPPPSNGGTIVAYLVMRFSFHPPVFGATASNSSTNYSRLVPSKTYSIDVWNVTTSPSEVKLWSVGSPANGTLTFESPLNDVGVEGTYVVLDLELVQNP